MIVVPDSPPTPGSATGSAPDDHAANHPRPATPPAIHSTAHKAPEDARI